MNGINTAPIVLGVIVTGIAILFLLIGFAVKRKVGSQDSDCQ